MCKNRYNNVMTRQPYGVINQSSLGRKDDYLYRISIKGLVRNEQGEVLVVKEAGRTWWDLPGGGMDHNENIKTALAREMAEEVGLVGDFWHRVIAVDEPRFLEHVNVWQVRLVFGVTPKNYEFEVGPDADELKFINPEELKNSDYLAERSIFGYVKEASG